MSKYSSRLGCAAIVGVVVAVAVGGHKAPDPQTASGPTASSGPSNPRPTRMPTPRAAVFEMVGRPTSDTRLYLGDMFEMEFKVTNRGQQGGRFVVHVHDVSEWASFIECKPACYDEASDDFSFRGPLAGKTKTYTIRYQPTEAGRHEWYMYLGDDGTEWGNALVVLL